MEARTLEISLQGIEKLGPDIAELNCRPKKPFVIIGVGNIVQSDDGLGPHAAYELSKDSSLQKKVDIFEAGNRVLDFLECIDRRKKAIVLDAFEDGGKPGEIHRVDIKVKNIKQCDDIPISFHDFTFVDAILSARDVFNLPEEIVIIGIEPQKVTSGIGLSQPVKKSLPKLIKLVKEEVKKCQAN